MEESALLTDTPPAAAWSADVLQQLNNRFDTCPPAELLQWSMATFSPDLALATSFGPQSIVLMHLMAQIDTATTVFYLDTDLLFPETYKLRDTLATRFGLRFTCVRTSLSLEDQAATYAAALWQHNPDVCCYLRKVEPLRRFLATQQAWITGIRRQHTATRARAQRIEWDKSNGLVKLNPLADWSTEQVWAYLRAHDLPVNPLHARGYPSIGCMPCTRPVQAGEEARAGRWAGWRKTECGIHV
jgi:phosphoadenosine phosphosulfate reductase